MKNRIEKEAYTAEEVRDKYGIATGTLAKWRSKKVGPVYFRLNGRKIVYFQSDLDTWVQQFRVLTSGEGPDRKSGG